MIKIILQVLVVVMASPEWGVCSRSNLVNMTLVRRARSLGAYCLDGSLPAYHLDRGFGSGTRNWLLQFEGGGWCNDVESCMERSQTRRGSTRYMGKQEVFSGILSNNASLNPGARKPMARGSRWRAEPGGARKPVARGSQLRVNVVRDLQAGAVSVKPA